MKETKSKPNSKNFKDFRGKFQFFASTEWKKKSPIEINKEKYFKLNFLDCDLLK